jgi:hypothetical protein
MANAGEGRLFTTKPRRARREDGRRGRGEFYLPQSRGGQRGKNGRGRGRGREKGEGRREKGEGRREKGEGRREKGEGRREKGEGRREITRRGRG